MKKILFLSCSMLFCSYNLHAEIEANIDEIASIIEYYLSKSNELTRSPTHRNHHQDIFIEKENLKTYANTFVNQCIESRGVTLAQLPFSIQQKISSLTDLVSEAITEELNKNNNNLINKNIFELMIKQASKTIMANASLYVKMQDITKTIDQNICKFFDQSKTPIHLIPEPMMKEFLERKKVVEKKLQILMQKEFRDYVLLPEISQTVQKTFNAFIFRVQRMLIWQLANEEIAYIKNSTSSDQTPCTSFSENPKSKELYNKLIFLHKNKN